MRLGIIYIVMVAMIGCISFGRHRTDEVYTGMNRTRITKDASGKETRTTEPIKVSRYPSDDRHSWLPIDAGNPRIDIDARAADTPPLSSPLPEVPGEKGGMNEPSSDSTGLHLRRIEAGVISTKLWNSYTTSFQSPDFNNIKWNPDVKVSGTGGEANLYFFQGEDPIALSIGGGVFSSKRTTNSFEQGGFFVRETTKTDTFWVDIGIHGKPYPWIYLQGLLGLFIYEAETVIETNATVYTYEGISGDRVFGAIGFGGGFETPWDYPLRLYTGARIWIPTSDDAFYESAVGQLYGGLLYRF